jgi:predicted nucleic acid-binding protein
MIVVSETSPLTAILTVGEENLLPKLFSEVVIPEAVPAPPLQEWPPIILPSGADRL